MNEMLLQFIWQYSLYNPINMQTTDGEAITVISAGKRNTDAGPDFLEARVKIGKTTLVGNIELHVKASDWNKHQHSDDQAYKNIILHVVYHDDKRLGNNSFSTLEIGSHIPAYVVDQYINLIQATQSVPCARQLALVTDLAKESWLNRLLAERWEQKLDEWKELLEQSAGDWRNLLYWRMAANFGFKTNSEAFLMLARSLPINILARHKDNLMQIEALLFGQAGMLDNSEVEDDYYAILTSEYLFLKKKYQLVPIPAHLWKFMRLRPPNFPTVRIAQFAALIHKSIHLFSKIINVFTPGDIFPLLKVAASEYWDKHYRFGESQPNSYPKATGDGSIENILINTIAPVQFLHAYYHGNFDGQEKALELLSSVKAETNKITSAWKGFGWKAQNAAHSQAQIQLFNSYCSRKRCLECAIGLGIIKNQRG